MKMQGYFHRVQALTPTRFWINNPTCDQARLAIEAGAVSCTTNPAYVSKLLGSGNESPSVREAIKRALSKGADNISEAAARVARDMLVPLLKEFLPLYEESPRKKGFVSIQGDPYSEHDPDRIIKEALEDVKLGKNVIAKIPVTRAGLAAVEYLVARDIPVIATEIMSIAQMIAVCEAYGRASGKSGHEPPLYVTHITGIFDEHLNHLAAAGSISVGRDALFQAGLIVARRQYKMMIERDYPGVLLGGGARGLHHFTEMVGGRLHVTINWNGAADRLLENDPPVVDRMDCAVPEQYLEELLFNVPDFERAYRSDGLTVDEFADFGPVRLFRSQFMTGWDILTEAVKEEMKK